MKCFLFHKWGKWEQFDVHNPARQLTENWALCASIDHKQKRTCERCGKVKQEIISSTEVADNE